jgi:hypothetical protein
MTTARATASSLLNSRYYDIDDFLADEELLPCTTTYDFALLAHLKADEGSAIVASSSSSSNQQQHNKGGSKQGQKDRHLSGNTKLKMPIWTLREWSRLNYVKIKLPKKYASAARDAVKADPLHFELSPSYFRTGKAIVQMLLNAAGGVGADGPAAAEAAELQQTLLLVRTTKHFFVLRPVWTTSTTIPTKSFNGTNHTPCNRHIRVLAWLKRWIGR